MLETIGWILFKSHFFGGAMLQLKSKVGEKWSTIINCIGDSVGSRILLTPGTWHSGHHKGDTFECAILDWPPLHSNVGLRFWHVTFWQWRWKPNLSLPVVLYTIFIFAFYWPQLHNNMSARDIYRRRQMHTERQQQFICVGPIPYRHCASVIVPPCARFIHKTVSNWLTSTPLRKVNGNRAILHHLRILKKVIWVGLLLLSWLLFDIVILHE